MQSLWIIWILFTLSSGAWSATLKCKPDRSPAPHTRVEADLNGDRIPDLFYLAGEEELFQTCIFLGEKRKGAVKMSLRHSHSGAYDTVLNITGGKRPQILVASDIVEACGESHGQDLMSERLKEEIRERYRKWSKGYEEFNFTYQMPEFFPVHNLFVLNDVKVYQFEGQKKKDVTKKVKEYLALKHHALSEVLKQQEIDGKCRAALEKNLKALNAIYKKN